MQQGEVQALRHELRTPLNHIIGYSEMLEEDLADATLCRQLEHVREHGQELLALINLASGHERVAVVGEWRPPLERLRGLVDGLQRHAAPGSMEADVWAGDVAHIASAVERLGELLVKAAALQAGAPAAEASAEETPLIEAAVTPGTSESPGGGPAAPQAASGRLLIVDDDASNRDLLRRRLVREGFVVETASHGREALDRLPLEEFDLVLLDLMMPDIDGIEVLKRIRAERSSHELPVIMVTARHGSGNIVRALAFGANDYVTKPLDFPVALARIATHLHLRRLSRELAQANEQLRRYSYCDGLTGIANRRRFDEHVRQEWTRARRNGTSLSLIMLDVDAFKAYNDNYGHDAGDRVLVRVAETLASFARRAGDLVARYGGEEFVAVLPETAAADACNIAEGMRQAVQGLRLPHAFSPAAAHVTVSLGVSSIVPREGEGLEEHFTRTDHALYRAKRTGRNRLACAGGPDGPAGCAAPCRFAPSACLPQEAC